MAVDVKHRLYIMNIILYKNSSEKNKINKELTEVANLGGTLRENTSIMNPVIRIARSSPTGFNYMYIPAFNRYYFVDDVVVNRTGLITVSASIDVLMSYKTQILNQKVIIEKSTNNYDNYLPDENLKVNVKTTTNIVNFPNGFLNSGEFILITAGG